MRHRTLLAAGTVGSVLLVLGGYGVGAVPRAYRWNTAASLPLCVVGVVVLLAAWWGLRDSGRARLAAALWSLPLLAGPPLFSRDVYAYAGQGQLVARGLDPYSRGPSSVPGAIASEVDRVWADKPSPYGPVFLWVAGHLGFGSHVLLAVLLLRMIAVSGLILAAWALPRLAMDGELDADRACWLGLANPLVLLHLVAGAHNDALMIGLLLAGLAVAAGRDRPWRLPLAAVLITLAALVKVPAVAGLAVLPLMRTGALPRLRAGLVVALTAAGTALSVTAATGIGWGWLHNLGQGRARKSLFSPATALGLATGHEDVVLRIGLIGGAAAAGLLLLRVRNPVRGLGLALVVVVAAGPTVQAWYLLWGFMLLAAVLGVRGTLAVAAASSVLCLLVLPSGRSLIRPPLYGLPLVLAGLAATAALVPSGRLQGSRT